MVRDEVAILTRPGVPSRRPEIEAVSVVLRHFRNVDSRECVKDMGIEEVIIAYRSPWQSPYVERLIGSIRRECLDHMIVFSEAHLRRLLTSYFAYYHECRAQGSVTLRFKVDGIRFAILGACWTLSTGGYSSAHCSNALRMSPIGPPRSCVSCNRCPAAVV